MKITKYLYIALFGITVFLFGAVFDRAFAKTSVSWNPNHINQTVKVGRAITISGTIEINENLESAVIRVVPTLAPFISVEPSSFADLKLGQTREVSIRISVSPTTPVGIVDGVIQLRSATKGNTISKPLPVVINIIDDPLAGIDANSNGVRDDVEVFIGNVYQNKARLLAMSMEIAKVKQINTTQTLSDEELKANYQAGTIAAICMLLEGVDIDDFSSRLQEIQFNTPARLSAFRAYEQRLSTLGSFDLPPTAQVKETCRSKY